MQGIWSTISYGVESQPWQNLGEGCFLTSQPESLRILSSPPKVPYYLGGELWQEWAVLLWWYGTCVNKVNTKPRWRGRWYLDPLIAICTMAQWQAPDGCSVCQHNLHGIQVLRGPFGSAIFTHSEMPRSCLLMGQCDWFLSFLSRWKN